MVIRKFTNDNLQTMRLFNSICGYKPIDCFSAEDVTIFITKEGQTAKAIGKNGTNIKKLQTTLKKEVKVIENSNSVEALVKNYLFPIKPEIVEVNKSLINIQFTSGRERRALLNNSQKELRKLKITLARYYPQVKDIQILQQNSQGVNL